MSVAAEQRVISGINRSLPVNAHVNVSLSSAKRARLLIRRTVDAININYVYSIGPTVLGKPRVE